MASLHEYEIYCGDKAAEGGEMIPLQSFAFEEYDGEQGEYHQSDGFLEHLQLHEREGPTVAGEAYAVGRHLAAVFGQSYAPREEDDGVERSVAADQLHILQFQVAIPGEGHEHVGHNQK